MSCTMYNQRAYLDRLTIAGNTRKARFVLRRVEKVGIYVGYRSRVERHSAFPAAKLLLELAFCGGIQSPDRQRKMGNSSWPLSPMRIY
jgi:hypothetical protein